jgi:hypothetical protein
VDIFHVVGIEDKENIPLISTPNQSETSQTKKAHWMN